MGRELGEYVLSGEVPGEQAARNVRRAVVIRKITSPLYAQALALRLRRVFRRLRQPTGLLVAIVGPDGSGKSTLARSLPGACSGLFRRDALFHWRPGVLPRPGAFVRSPLSDLPDRMTASPTPRRSRPHSCSTSGPTSSSARGRASTRSEPGPASWSSKEGGGISSWIHAAIVSMLLRRWSRSSESCSRRPTSLWCVKPQSRW